MPRMSRRSAAERPPREQNVPGLAEQTVQEDKLAHGPAHRLDGLLRDSASVIKQGHMRREMRLYPAPEAGFHPCHTENLAKRHQCGEAVGST